MKKLESLLLICTLSCAILFNFISFVDKHQFHEKASQQDLHNYEYALDSGWFWWEESLDDSKKVTLLVTRKDRLELGEYIQLTFDFKANHGSNLALGTFKVHDAQILWSSDQLKSYSGSDVNLEIDITSMKESKNGLETTLEGTVRGILINKGGQKENITCRFSQVI